LARPKQLENEMSFL